MPGSRSCATAREESSARTGSSHTSASGGVEHVAGDPAGSPVVGPRGVDHGGRQCIPLRAASAHAAKGVRDGEQCHTSEQLHGVNILKSAAQ